MKTSLFTLKDISGYAAAASRLFDIPLDRITRPSRNKGREEALLRAMVCGRAKEDSGSTIAVVANELGMSRDTVAGSIKRHEAMLYTGDKIYLKALEAFDAELT